MNAAARLKAIDLAQARGLLEPDLFDAAFYRRQAHLRPEDDGFAHYFREGFRAGLRPNVVFEPDWYLDQNPEAAEAGVEPLLHYAVIGEAAGRDPSSLFDVVWYRQTYGAERPLAHYLARRFGAVSPIPEFDAGFYLKTYPDVVAARMDPFLHYMHFGFREFRKPFAGFNPRLYAHRSLAHDRGANPIAHLRGRQGAAAGNAPPPANPFDAVKTYARPGPRFEDLASPIIGRTPGALVLAFHLTQYHRVAENDAWWGEGFTEWTNLARGQPRFAGHQQPRIPGQLGFYDLGHPDAIRAQAALAQAAGVHAFVYYYYDFDGRRLLEKPLEAFLAAPDIDIGFCLMWANENWTRRWDGAEQDVLIAQTYDERYELQRCAEWARHFRDSRYLRLDGRPLLMVYRGGLIPDAARGLARWRRLFAERFQENPVFVTAQCFDDVDPRPLGFDGAVEFPPHKLTKNMPQIFDSLEIFDEGFEAHVFAYDDLVEASLAEAAPDFPLIKTAVPSWDNDARREGRGLTLVGSTPGKYERWLAELIARAQARPFFGSALVCVNAWNEWSEGAYLEPDVYSGAAYLNATARAAFGEPAPKARLAVLGGPHAGRLAEVARDFAVGFGLAVEVFADSTAALAAGAPQAALVAESRSLLALAEAGVRTAWLAAPLRDARDSAALRRADVVVFADTGAKQQALAAAGLADEAKFVVAASPDAARPEGSDADGVARALFPLLFPETAKVSVFVRNRNGAKNLAPALRSIFAQTHPVWEIVVLDDASREDALRVVEGLARTDDRDVTLVFDDQLAAGDVAFWRCAADMASGDFVWIADAEGLSAPTLLSSLARPMRADPRLVMAFCDSRPVDEEGRPLHLAPSPLAPPKRSVSFVDQTFEGAQFAAKFLAKGCPIDNLGAALWRRPELGEALAMPESQGEFDAQRLCIAVAAKPQARIRHVAEALDFVRRPSGG